MLETLKGKLHSVQRDFSSRFKSAAVSTPPSTSAKLNLDAGAEILKRYEHHWQACHELSEENVRIADIASRRLSKYESNARRSASQVLILHREVNSLPRLAEDLTNLVSLTAEVQGLCEEINSSLTFLEVICDTQKQQEEKLDLRFQLALYREKKVNQLNEAKDDLSLEYIQRVELREKEREKEEKEKQQLYQHAFEQDLQLYKTTGFIANSLPPLQVTTKSRVPETLPELRDVFLSSRLHGLAGQNTTHNVTMKENINENEIANIEVFDKDDLTKLQMFLKDSRLEDSGIGNSDYNCAEQDNEN